MISNDDLDADDVLEAVRRQLIIGPHPVTSAPEIAEHLPIGRRRVHHYLEALEFAGEIESVKVGSGRAWYIPDVIETIPPAEPPAEPSAEPAAVRSEEPSAAPAVESSDDSPEQLVPPAEPSAAPPAEMDEEREQAIEQLHIPGSGQLPSQRREALRAVLTYLDTQGTTSAGELRDELYGEYPAGYQTPRSWWKNFVSQKLSDLEEQGHVQLVSRSRGRWKTL